MKPYIVKVDGDYREDHTLERIRVNASITPVAATRCTQYDFMKLINLLIKQGLTEEEAEDLIHQMMEEVVRELDIEWERRFENETI